MTATAQPTRVLGRTGLPVTALGYGAMELRGAPRGRDISDDECRSVLNAVLDTGINYIDTSIDYGRSERLIGEAIANRRSEYFLASKCGCVYGSDAVQPVGQRSDHVFTAENVISGVNGSLERLRTDYLDLVQFHISPSMQTLWESGSLEALKELQRAGKVRFIGMSGTQPHLADQIASGEFDVFQIPYSALQRENEALITAAAEAGAGVVIRGGVAKGDHSRVWAVWEKAGLDDLLDGMTPVQFLLRFTLSHPGMHTTIVGTANPAHLQANADTALLGPLPAATYAEAKRRLDAVPEAMAPIR